MKNKTLKFEVPEEIKEKLRAVVKKQEEIEEMDGKIKVKKKRNWKKIAAYTAAGLAVVGAGIAIAVKLKNGDDISDEMIPLISVPASSTCTDLFFNGENGTEYYAKTLWDKTGEVMSTCLVDKMSIKDLSDMFDQLAPEVTGITNETMWDQILLVREV